MIVRPTTPRNAASTKPVARAARAASENGRRGGGESFVVGFAARDGKAVSASTNRLDGLEVAFRIELPAQSTDEDLQHVGVAIEILLVDVLGQVGLGDQLTGMQHQV